MKHRTRLSCTIISFFVVFACFASFASERNGIHNPARKQFGPPASFDRSFLIQEEPSPGPSVNNPSKGKAFMFSLVLPGAGEYYAGSRKMARIFFGVEVFLWAAYFSFRSYGNWKRDDYRQFAAVHAGVDPSGKDHTYFVDVENYDNIRDYNQAKLQQRNVDAMYPETGEYAWDWDSEASRKTFESLRLASDTAYKRSLFVIGGVVLNHLISAIDAVRLARKSGPPDPNRMTMGVAGIPHGGMMVTIHKSF
jgi:hypothetical protein